MNKIFMHLILAGSFFWGFFPAFSEAGLCPAIQDADIVADFYYTVDNWTGLTSGVNAAIVTANLGGSGLEQTILIGSQLNKQEAGDVESSGGSLNSAGSWSNFSGDPWNDKSTATDNDYIFACHGSVKGNHGLWFFVTDPSYTNSFISFPGLMGEVYDDATDDSSSSNFIRGYFIHWPGSPQECGSSFSFFCYSGLNKNSTFSNLLGSAWAGFLWSAVVNPVNGLPLGDPYVSSLSSFLGNTDTNYSISISGDVNVWQPLNNSAGQLLPPPDFNDFLGNFYGVFAFSGLAYTEASDAGSRFFFHFAIVCENITGSNNTCPIMGGIPDLPASTS
jgi:hypothetical protein